MPFLQVSIFLPIPIAVWVELEEGIKHFTSWTNSALEGGMEGEREGREDRERQWEGR